MIICTNSIQVWINSDTSFDSCYAYQPNRRADTAKSTPTVINGCGPTRLIECSHMAGNLKLQMTETFKIPRVRRYYYIQLLSKQGPFLKTFFFILKDKPVPVCMLQSPWNTNLPNEWMAKLVLRCIIRFLILELLKRSVTFSNRIGRLTRFSPFTSCRPSGVFCITQY